MSELLSPNSFFFSVLKRKKRNGSLVFKSVRAETDSAEKRESKLLISIGFVSLTKMTAKTFDLICRLAKITNFNKTR